ncbi:hypothetical protein CFC21_112550 [Triticum aestivum]|uniref:Pectinesterase inhibitor domain-containing protein n=2 Tax=Triticum aestivum TaxID=4565 RepID=A0A9R0G532_WHEAT|nr:uncharacterized protein LOC123172916 [Triticum aestivum]MBC2899727.1 hypothetical protein [Triticum aestivum]
MTTTMMTTISFSAILFILLSVAITAETNDSGSGMARVTNVMVEACKNASGYHRELKTMTHEFCLSTLRSDNRSVEAKDHLELVLVAIDILKGRLTTANHNIEKMLEKAKNGTVPMRDLSICKVYYDTTMRIVNICDDMVKDFRGDKGRLKSFELPRCVDRAGYPVDECWFGLQFDMPWADALMSENREIDMVVNLDYAFLAPYDVSD